VQNAYARHKREVLWARAHHIPGASLMDRSWVLLNHETKVGAVALAYDKMAAIYIEAMSEEEKHAFLDAFEAYERGDPPPSLPAVPDHARGLQIRLTNLDPHAGVLVTDAATRGDR
jgi:hypothetical protein